MAAICFFTTGEVCLKGQRVHPLFGSDPVGITLTSVAHIIQTALTPVFLLTGLATLLNVFSTRLARVSAKADQTVKELRGADTDAVLQECGFSPAEIAALRAGKVI